MSQCYRQGAVGWLVLVEARAKVSYNELQQPAATKTKTVERKQSPEIENVFRFLAPGDTCVTPLFRAALR